ncbi:hypothetical protein SNEBB_006653 [Seison nebaliae]|nr:hypothetical protein SNEBB_006653 [Seison nebaliae]
MITKILMGIYDHLVNDIDVEEMDLPGGGSEGYHILRVAIGSPCSTVGVEPFFDFLVGVNDMRLTNENNDLRNILQANEEKEVEIMVYSSKSRKVRKLRVTPSKKWGTGDDQQFGGLLGISIRFCSFNNAANHVWHVLDVQHGSPAELAGLRSNTDYIIGSDQILDEPDDLFDLIEAFEQKPLRLFVYSREKDYCRELVLTPNRAWGGEGSIGCSISYGILHRIPQNGRKLSSGKDRIEIAQTETSANEVKEEKKNENVMNLLVASNQIVDMKDEDKIKSSMLVTENNSSEIIEENDKVNSAILQQMPTTMISQDYSQNIQFPTHTPILPPPNIPFSSVNLPSHLSTTYSSFPQMAPPPSTYSTLPQQMAPTLTTYSMVPQMTPPPPTTYSTLPQMAHPPLTSYNPQLSAMPPNIYVPMPTIQPTDPSKQFTESLQQLNELPFSRNTQFPMTSHFQPQIDISVSNENN